MASPAELSRQICWLRKNGMPFGVLAAQARLDDLVSGARSQEIKEALARVNMAGSTYEQAERELERMQELFAEGAIAEEKLEQSRLNSELRKNELTAAEARLSLLESGSRPGAISAAAAELERSKAVLKSSEALLDDLKMPSPLEET